MVLKLCFGDYGLYTDTSSATKYIGHWPSNFFNYSTSDVLYTWHACKILIKEGFGQENIIRATVTDHSFKRVNIS